jgi:hypothetical protein
MESRLSKLLAAGEQMSQGRTLKEIIRGGQATSITATWSFLGALPHLFERLGEDAPSEEQLRKATHAVFRFMTSLAAHHFHAFVGLFQICRTDCQSGTSLMKGGIDSSHVLLAVNNQGDYALCPSTKLARRVIEHVEQRASHKDGQLPTTGCPALFAAAGEGTVVPELLAWVLEVAEKYYFPYVLSTRRRC